MQPTGDFESLTGYLKYLLDIGVSIATALFPDRDLRLVDDATDSMFDLQAATP
jgi:hypothetical protein